MPHVLVAFASASGSTRSVAEVVAEALRSDGVTADLRDIAEDPDAALYDAVILGADARYAAWRPEPVAWLQRHAEAVRERPHALFTVCLAIKDPTKVDIVRSWTAPLIEELELAPVEVGAFPGWYLPERLPADQHLALDKAPEPGDWRDLEAVAAWARRMNESFAA